MTEHAQLGEGGEFRLIEQFISLPHPQLTIGIGDDCAILVDGTAISVDTSVENVHFRREWLSSYEIGYRAAAVALSDLAAVAAKPIAVLVALSLAKDDYGEVATEIMRGVTAAAHHEGAVVAGGDTTATDGPLSIAVTVLGYTDLPVLRSGACEGDAVFVTGILGRSAAAVRAWNKHSIPSDAERAAFAAPHARIKEALWLVERADIESMIDVSDGLLGDARHIAAASDVRLELEAELVPRDPNTPVELAAGGGDDYELLFTADEDDIAALAEAFEQRFGIPITRIGVVKEGAGAVLLSIDGAEIEVKSYDHFEEQS